MGKVSFLMSPRRGLIAKPLGLPPTYMIKLCDWLIMTIEDDKP